MPHIMGNFNITSRCASAYRDEMFSEFGLTDAQYPYVLRIARSPGITQDELSHQLCIHKSNVARQVATLEQNGFISRVEDPSDRRIRHLHPTEKAIELLPKIREVLRSWNRYVMADLSEQEFSLLESLLERMCRRARMYFETGSLELSEDSEE
jgi:DNA-binding MarR family transcriptional regulator